MTHQPDHETPRHRVALVLGSGGVRSAAAIGVQEILERAGYKPTLIVGCSSGAVFGAVLAQHWPAPQALKTTTSLWTQELTTQRRWRAYAQLLMPRLARFGPDFAMRDSSRIAERVRAAFGGQRIEQLPTTLRVAATDSRTGQGAILREGDLVDALLASMALPFIFPAVNFGGQRLIDGVISDPLPVSAAADADVVLTLGFQGVMPRRIDRPSRLFGQVSTALMNNLMQARLQAARAAGQQIVPIELQVAGRVGLWETAAIPALYKAGAEAALRAIPSLEAALARREVQHPTTPWKTLSRAA